MRTIFALAQATWVYDKDSRPISTGKSNPALVAKGTHVRLVGIMPETEQINIEIISGEYAGWNRISQAWWIMDLHPLELLAMAAE